MTKYMLVDTLKNIARLMELTNENVYRSAAFNTAARSLNDYTADFDDLVKNKRWQEIPSIGAGIEKTILSLIEKGTDEVLESLKKKVPISLLELYSIPGLGSKKIRSLYEGLGITTLGELEYACQKNRLLSIPGFGAKSQEKILKEIAVYRSYQGFFLYSHAYEEAKALKKAMEDMGVCKKCVPVGALRRCNEVVSEIELLVIAASPRQNFIDKLTLVGIVNPQIRSEKLITGNLLAGIPVKVHLSDETLWGTDLICHTGNGDHLQQLLAKAAKKEYLQGNRLPAGSSEAEIYKLIGIPLVPPELREGLWEFSGENPAAIYNSLPTLDNIKGVLHVHSNFSDGTNTLAEIAGHGRTLGYEYIGIADHSQAAAYAGGLKPADLRRQITEIDALNAGNSGPILLKGLEVDILSDGSLDCSKELMKELDFTVISIHSNFKMPKSEMTKRIIKAISQPFVTILGHPTGRLLLSREPYAVDLAEVIKACKYYNVIPEINANPWRLDLDWRWARRAYEEGLYLSINPDAHRLTGFDHTEYGINMARKAGLPKDRILNTRGLQAVKIFLKETKNYKTKK